MVPLIQRSTYLDELRRNAKFDLFFQFLNGERASKTFQIESDIDEIFAGVIHSIWDNQADAFNKNLQNLATRTPKNTSPFVNDDLLIFVIIVGVKKFSVSIDPVVKILNAREGEDSEGKAVTKTLLNLVNGNYTSLENEFEVVIALEGLLLKNLVTAKEKIIFYRRVVNKRFPFHKSDFMNTVSLRAFDLMISQADKLFSGEYEVLDKFKMSFQKRAKIIARAVQITIMVLLSFGLYRLGTLIPSINSFFQNFEPIVGILGLSVLGNVIPAINNLFYRLILRFFKFPG